MPVISGCHSRKFDGEIMAPRVGRPPSVNRAGVSARVTPCWQDRQAYFGRTATITRSPSNRKPGAKFMALSMRPPGSEPAVEP